MNKKYLAKYYQLNPEHKRGKLRGKELELRGKEL